MFPYYADVALSVQVVSFACGGFTVAWGTNHVVHGARCDRRTGAAVETATVGLGSPALSVSAFSSFAVDTDFGFGHAAMAVPTTASAARLCSGFVQIVARPGGDGSWLASAFLWPQLAAALKPVTAEYLGLCPASASSAKRAGIITSKI
uniref:Uncharacterized protein n=1 Tax=Leersia perrieri TaxID=77586 RepID=A0A0D9UZB0_9ORYZ